MTPHLSITLSASIATLLASSPLAAGYSLRLVAQTGDFAPGSLNGAFIALGHPQINASGQVAFVGYTDGAIADTGMWKTKFDNPQQLALVIGQDYPVPGSPPGVRFGGFIESNHHPLLVDSGDIGFAAPVEGLGLDGIGIFRMVNGGIQRILVTGDAAPGTGAGVMINSIGNLPSASPNLEFAINADLSGAGVNDGNRRIVYRSRANGTVAKIARSGDVAPGLRGTDLMLWPLQIPQIHNSGELAFRASLEGAVTQPWSRWNGTPGNLDLIVKRGDAAPLGGFFAGESIDFWTMTLTDDAVTMSEDVETNIGVFRTIARFDNGGTLELAREGKLGPLGFYAELADAQPEVANDGTTVFAARFNGVGLPADKDSPIVRRRPAVSPVALLQEGEHADGGGTAQGKVPIGRRQSARCDRSENDRSCSIMRGHAARGRRAPQPSPAALPARRAWRRARDTRRAASAGDLPPGRTP